LIADRADPEAGQSQELKSTSTSLVARQYRICIHSAAAA